MTLIRQYRPSARITFDELDGLLKLLEEAIIEHADNGETSTYYYVGACFALEIIRNHEHIEYPADFMAVLDNKINGIDD